MLILSGSSLIAAREVVALHACAFVSDAYNPEPVHNPGPATAVAARGETLARLIVAVDMLDGSPGAPVTLDDERAADLYAYTRDAADLARDACAEHHRSLDHRRALASFTLLADDIERQLAA